MKKGDRIPSFSAKDENGTRQEIDQWLGRQILVIYFYPKDDSPGCTKEACSFRDQYEAFEDAGAKVIGISTDDPESHKEFKEKHNLPFTLLSDEKKEIRKLFDVPSSFLGMIPGRVTYIVDEEGIVKEVFDSQLNPTKHVKKALDTIRSLKKSN